MCNLYRLNRAPAEVAQYFGARVANLGNWPEEGADVYPGYPGLVPSHSLPRRAGLDPGPGCLLHPRREKLDPGSSPGRRISTTRMCQRDSFAKRRCLIPLTPTTLSLSKGEAEGEKGAKTRTWFSLPPETDSAHPELVKGSSARPSTGSGRAEAPIFAAAGLWRQTDEWGLAYTMVMTEACLHVSAKSRPS